MARKISALRARCSQSDRIWSWAVHTLQSHDSAQQDTLAVAAFFVCRAADTLLPVRIRVQVGLPRLFRLLTAFRSTSQRGAANLYTSSLRPWLAGMRLPWTKDSAPPTEPWSALEHVVWASEKHTPEKAVALAATVPLVLECHLAVERCVALRHRRSGA